MSRQSLLVCGIISCISFVFFLISVTAIGVSSYFLHTSQLNFKASTCDYITTQMYNDTKCNILSCDFQECTLDIICEDMTEPGYCCSGSDNYVCNEGVCEDTNLLCNVYCYNSSSSLDVVYSKYLDKDFNVSNSCYGLNYCYASDWFKCDNCDCIYDVNNTEFILDSKILGLRLLYTIAIIIASNTAFMSVISCAFTSYHK